jgi:hypothetical protein
MGFFCVVAYSTDISQRGSHGDIPIKGNLIWLLRWAICWVGVLAGTDANRGSSLESIVSNNSYI